MTSPDIRFAKAGDVHIAYEVFGTGPLDLVVSVNHGLSFEAAWDEPSFTRFLERLGSFARVIRFDRRGMGLSDPAPDPYTLEQSPRDFVAVLDDLGVERVAFFGLDSPSSSMGILCAATHPSRVSSLVLVHPVPRTVRTEDYPWGMPLELLIERREEFERGLVSSEGLMRFFPSRADDARFFDWLKRWRRRGASPATQIAIARVWNELDIRPVLPAVRVPTLVLRRVGCDQSADIAEHCRYVAEHIPQARYAELPGVDHAAFVGETGPLLDAAEEFLLGTKAAVVVDDRVFAAVLFTDIVSSTPRTAELGDRRWRELLDAHDEAVRREVERFRGRLVKSTGDGVLATFDGPARAVRCAQSIGAAVGRLGLETRVGIHAGEVELRGEDITGIAVSIARRVCDAAATGELLVSRTVTDLVAGSGLSFEDHGEHELKGVPGRWRLYAVAS